MIRIQGDNLADLVAHLRGAYGLDRLIATVATDTATLITRAAIHAPDDETAIEKLSKIQRLLIHAQTIAESLKL